VALYVLAARPVPSHDVIDMSALTTSATQEFQVSHGR
jgi:hypothetical protein